MLLLPNKSSWATAHVSKLDRALITLTGFNFVAFEHPHLLLVPLFHSHTPHSKDGYVRKLNEEEQCGHPCSMTTHACLELCPLWCCTMCPYWMLSTTFGFIGTSYGLWFYFAKRIVVHIFSQCNDATVTLPNGEQIACYKMAIEEHYLILQDVACIGDGLKIPLQKASEPLTEVFYNGW